MSTEPENLDPPERLGTVSAPSGVLVVLDGGLLKYWQHDKEPLLPEGAFDSPETVKKANSAIDLRIEGPDAWKAGFEFDRGCHPLFLYDIPAHAVAEMQERFAAFASDHGLDAQAVPLARRISHRERITRLLADGAAENGIAFHGIWAAVVGDVPAQGIFPVYGRRRSKGLEFEGRLHDAYVEIRPDAEMDRSESRGLVGVDEARIIFADADALGAWVHEEPLDGKADFAFWGRDAADAAAEAGAKALDRHEGIFGWKDVPVAEAARLGVGVEELRQQRDWRFATDFRPHSHHWQAMEQVRATETESGTVSVGGAEMCLFMTSWGDGIFEVFADYDSAGNLVRARILLGSDQTMRNMRAIEERYFGYFAKMAFASKRVFEDGQCVRFLYREAPDREQDSGWRVFAGGEADEYSNGVNNIVLLPLRELVDRDKSLEAIFRRREGSVFERASCGDEFVPVTDWTPRED